MFQIPSTFSSENESYITLPAMKRFAKERRKQELKTTVDRAELIEDIENYANQSADNKEAVLDWLDSVLREGIKEVQIKFLDVDIMQMELLGDDKNTVKLLEPMVSNPVCRHLCNKYEEELKLFRYEINDTKRGKIISLYMGKLLSCYDKKNGASLNAYPIIVQIFVNEGIIVGKAKSKAGMYIYMKDFVLEAATTTSAEKEMKKAIKYIAELFGVELKKASESLNIFRGSLFRMLDKYTKTPQEIIDLMDANSTLMNTIQSMVMTDICELKNSYSTDVSSDINNMIEKYFSISYSDKSIFTKDREAYPLKIMATDDEDSKLEQTAALEEPLQSKAVFFDNKKMLQKSKLCDGVYFRFLRLTPKYFSKEFNVKITTKSDYCTLKFTEYTVEEDMHNVLFSLIYS